MPLAEAATAVAAVTPNAAGAAGIEAAEKKVNEEFQ